jgi:hypothetical protein
MFDIIFISYKEENAEENWNNLKARFPFAKRVHGITGIHAAHVCAANLSFTKMFWVVDGDAEIVDTFDFKIPNTEVDAETVYVCRSINPINDLIYGNGGVKLFPTRLTKQMNTSTVDMTTSISSKFKIIDRISNVTVFNTSPFNTWRSAFRECAKLSSKIINRQKDNETIARLETWCTVGEDRPYGKYAINGAIKGKEYGLACADKLEKINNFQWLKKVFDDTQW